MADKTDQPPPISPETLNLKLSEDASAHAPFLYFDQASAFGHMNGIIQITLEAARMLPNPSDSGVTLERVLTAHLRMNVQAARSLKTALEGALLLAAPPQSETKN